MISLTNMPENKPKIIVILGPTASGKSSLGITLAQEFNGEVISADSRQVYRGMDIGSGKVHKEEQTLVPHHLLDIVDPMADFSLAHYQQAAFAAIDDIIARGKIPFLVGGTALYIYSVIDNYNLTNVGANLARRKELEKLSLDELTVIASTLAGINSALAKRSNPEINSGIASVASLLRNDIKNPRRLIRAIEKLEAGASLDANKKPPRYEALILGIDVPRDELYKKIDQRVDERLQPADSAGKGMIEEVIKLRQTVPDEKLIGFGLEYRWITEYLQSKHTKEIMIERLKGAIHAFARRQMTWWKKDKRIVWIKNKTEALTMIEKFI